MIQNLRRGIGQQKDLNGRTTGIVEADKYIRFKFHGVIKRERAGQQKIDGRGMRRIKTHRQRAVKLENLFRSVRLRAEILACQRHARVENERLSVCVKETSATKCARMNGVVLCDSLQCQHAVECFKINFIRCAVGFAAQISCGIRNGHSLIETRTAAHANDFQSALRINNNRLLDIHAEIKRQRAERRETNFATETFHAGQIKGAARADVERRVQHGQILIIHRRRVGHSRAVGIFHRERAI